MRLWYWLRNQYWRFRTRSYFCRVLESGDVTFNKPPKKDWRITVVCCSDHVNHTFECGGIVPKLRFHVFLQGAKVRQIDV